MFKKMLFIQSRDITLFITFNKFYCVMQTLFSYLAENFYEMTLLLGIFALKAME